MLWKSNRTLELVSRHLYVDASAFQHPIKKTVETMQVLKRGVKVKGQLSTAWKQFSYFARSFTSTAASENGARQCIRDYWECTHFQDATQSQIPMEEEMFPPCEYSLKRTSANLIQSWGGQCCSERPAHNGHCFILPLNCQKESTSLNAARHEIYRNRRNLPPLKSLPQPTRTWHCTCREPIFF